MLLEWLSDAEMKLRFAGPLPEDEQETRNQLTEHDKYGGQTDYSSSYFLHHCLMLRIVYLEHELFPCVVLQINATGSLLTLCIMACFVL